MGSSWSWIRRRLAIGASLVGTLSLLVLLDRGLIAQAAHRCETALLKKQLKRAFAKPQAKTVVLGQSTTGQFLTSKRLSRMLGVAEREVLDAHLSGCHQECSYAETRRMLEQGRHFERAFIGLNLYQMCDSEVLKRHLQTTTMLPLRDTASLFSAYWEGRDGLGQISRHVGTMLFPSYGDSQAIQASLGRALFGDKRKGDDWARPRAAKASAARAESKSTKRRRGLAPTCSLEPEDIAGRIALTRELFATLEQLADRTYVLALPDRSLTAESAEDRELAKAFVELLGSLAEAYPTVSVVDLSTQGPAERKQYRDGVHLNARGLKHQSQLFKRQLKALGEGF